MCMLCVYVCMGVHMYRCKKERKYVCICVCVCMWGVCTCMHSGAHDAQKRAARSQVVVGHLIWVLGTKLGSSVHTLKQFLQS